MADPSMDILRTLVRGLAAGVSVSEGQGKYKITESQKTLDNIVKGRAVRDAQGRFSGYAQFRGQEVSIALNHLSTQIMLLLEANLEKLTGEQHLTLGQLRKLHHPYALRDPNLAATKLYSFGIVNKQSGAFTKGFTYELQSQNGGMMSILASNNTPEAKMLAEGTKRMVTRPFDALAASQTQNEAQADIERTSELITKLGGDASLAQMPKISYNLNGLRRQF